MSSAAVMIGILRVNLIHNSSLKWLTIFCRFLFWTNWNNEKPRIQRSNLQGLESRDVITKDILTPNGLTIDHKARKLYWSDARLDKIERCDMDGLNRIVSFFFLLINSPERS